MDMLTHGAKYRLQVIIFAKSLFFQYPNFFKMHTFTLKVSIIQLVKLFFVFTSKEFKFINAMSYQEITFTGTCL